LHGKHATGDAAYALVDFTDAEEVLKYTWRAHKGYLTFYATASIGGTTVRMHRMLLGLGRCASLKDDVTDHVNGNGLDNRKSNLRVCSSSQNARNRRRSHSRSGHKGVSWDKVHGVWQAHVKLHGVKKKIGTFSTPELAAAAYDREATRLYEGFARTNAAIAAQNEARHQC
jgi:hypothetical protein